MIFWIFNIKYEQHFLSAIQLVVSVGINYNKTLTIYINKIVFLDDNSIKHLERKNKKLKSENVVVEINCLKLNLMKYLWFLRNQIARQSDKSLTENVFEIGNTECVLNALTIIACNSRLDLMLILWFGDKIVYVMVLKQLKPENDVEYWPGNQFLIPIFKN